MRIRNLRIDPVVLGIAVAVTIVALLAGAGFLAIAAGGLTLGAALGSQPVSQWLARRWTLPPSHTLERALVLRSRAAAQTMRRINRAVPDGPVAQRCRDMERNARSALPTIRDLAFQACHVRGLAASIDVARLEGDRIHVQSLLAGEPEERVRIELASSLRSAAAQLATGRRLVTLADELAARTGSLTNSMEAIAAGLAELFALSSTDPTAQPQGALAALSQEIDALRAGLEEAQTFGRHAAAVHLMEA